MPFWVEGWIEVARSPDTASARAWFGVVDLSSLVFEGKRMYVRTTKGLWCIGE